MTGNEHGLLQKRFRDCQLPELIIGGYRVCYHARIRMAARRIEPDWVAAALDAPGRPNGTVDTRKHVGDKAMCVVNVQRRCIITVGYGRCNNPNECGS